MQGVIVSVKSAGLALEARLELTDALRPCAGVVLCHPHPLYGGDMDNNIIAAVSRALVRRGMASLRFNFRGVGRSQGRFAGGVGEQEDAEAALSFLAEQAEIDPSRLGIMGYSFGGMVALAVAARSSLAKAVATVSPVIPDDLSEEYVKPKLIVCGAEDALLPPALILPKAAVLEEPKRVKIVPGADHFWRGREEEAADLVADFFAEFLKA